MRQRLSGRLRLHPRRCISLQNRCIALCQFCQRMSHIAVYCTSARTQVRQVEKGTNHRSESINCFPLRTGFLACCIQYIRLFPVPGDSFGKRCTQSISFLQFLCARCLSHEVERLTDHAYSRFRAFLSHPAEPSDNAHARFHCSRLLEISRPRHLLWLLLLCSRITSMYGRSGSCRNVRAISSKADHIIEAISNDSGIRKRVDSTFSCCRSSFVEDGFAGTTIASAFSGVRDGRYLDPFARMRA